MGLVIRTTGLEQYAPGGEARVKLLIIGGPGVGKTRFASYFPKPIYADCEAGLASVADRRVPYVSVNSSIEMLDLLTHLKQECRLPRDKRTYETVVVDTLDAYQRKLKNEWMEKERKEAFTGWEAWGFVGQKMQLLLTRLLNLDMNVIVNVHYKDKTTKDDDTGKETHELMLQLQGEVSDTAFNDFDQVGWMGTYWEAVGGERVLKRGLTFRPTPDKPFLKDRLHVTPTWMEVTFDESDYQQLFHQVAARLEELSPAELVGEIPSAEEEVSAAVVQPDSAVSGALPEQPRPELPLHQLDRPALLKKARDMGITTTAGGVPIKGNTTKGELLAAIEHHLAGAGAATTPEPAVEAPIAAVVDDFEKAITTAVSKPAVVVPRQIAPDIEQLADGVRVDKRTGEIVEPTADEAIETVEKTLGGRVIADTPHAVPEPARTPAAAAALNRRTTSKPAENVCETCGKDLAKEKQDYVKLAWIKYRKRLCEADYQATKNG